jgi:hypothetical protein
MFHTLMGDISHYLGSSKHGSKADKLLQRVADIQARVREQTERARAATVAAAEVAVRAAAAAQRAAEEAVAVSAKVAEEESPFGFESNNNSPVINERFAKANVNGLKRYREPKKASRESKKASKSGKRAATRRR